MKTGLRISQEWTFTAKPVNGMSLDELEKRLVAAGNKIISREPDGIVIGREERAQTFITEEV